MGTTSNKRLLVVQSVWNVFMNDPTQLKEEMLILDPVGTGERGYNQNSGTGGDRSYTS